MDVIVQQPSRTGFTKRKRQASFSGPKKRPKYNRQGTAIVGAAAFRSNPANFGGNNYSRNQGAHGKEIKDLDNALSLEASTTGTITLLNGLAQGTDFTQRVGRIFNMTSILLRGHVSVGATPTGACYRYMVVYDKQANGAAPLISDILVAISMEGCNVLNNRNRFVVLLDKTGYVEATGTITRPIEKFLKCSLETTNSGTGGTVASISTGALYCLAVGNLATGVTAPVLTLTGRIRFSDN